VTSLARLFAAAAVLSLLLAIAAAASWVRSYWTYDQVSCGAADLGGCEWKSYDASFPFPRWPPGMPAGASSAVLICFGKILLQQSTYSAQSTGAPWRGYAWSSDANILPTFSYLHAVTGDMSGKGQWTVRQATAPHWALVLSFAALPVAWLVAWRHRNVRSTQVERAP
jgi:hypothetical protein